MFSRRIVLLALWSVACGAVPALATLDPVVKPAINKVPNQPLLPYVTPDNPQPPNPNPIKADPRFASTYNDGRTCPGGAVCETVKSPYPVVTLTSYTSPKESCGWWEQGPIRRVVSAPFRGIGRFFRNGGFLRRGWR